MSEDEKKGTKETTKPVQELVRILKGTFVYKDNYYCKLRLDEDELATVIQIYDEGRLFNSCDLQKRQGRKKQR